MEVFKCSVEPYALHAHRAGGHSEGSGHRTHDVGPCHHGMARPRVADGGMASYMEGSCE